MFKRSLKHFKQSLVSTFHLFGDAHNDKLDYSRAPNAVSMQPAYLQPLGSPFGYDMAEKITASLQNHR